MLSIHDHPSGEPLACLLRSSTFETTLEVRGLAAAELRSRLLEQGTRLDWASLSNRGPVTVRLQQNQGHYSTDTNSTWETDLADGRVSLRSGGQASITIDPTHADTPALLPASLYLALAQQWAQAGLLPVHAAVMDFPDHGGVLAVGQKGAGKSILAAAALAAGAKVVSDDWVLIGKRNNQWQAERIRSFFMLRESWASQELLKNAPHLKFDPHTHRPKQLRRLHEYAPETPAACHLKTFWLLERPRTGRHSHSAVNLATPSRLLASLVEASMPVLFSQKLPHEHHILTQLAQSFVLTIRGYILTTGTDLIVYPKQTLEKLNFKSTERRR